MLEDMERIEASCVFYVEVGMLNRLDQCKICVLNVTTLGIAMQTILHYMMLSVCFMYDPRDFLRQPSADIHSVKECAVYISQTSDFSGHSPRFIPGNKQTRSIRLGANCSMAG